MISSPDILTVKDIKKILKIGRVTAYQLVNTENFPAIRIGKIIRIPKDKFYEWLNNQLN